MTEYKLFGIFNEEQAGHPEHYYAERYTFLDMRGEFHAAQTSQFGFCNRIITATHNIRTGEFGGVEFNRSVHILPYAWITSFCLLYNCIIGEYSVVSCGSVVSNVIVPPRVIVEGNPAKIVKRWNGNKWKSVSPTRLARLERIL